MRVRHEVKAPAVEDVKEQVRTHRLTPIVLTAAATLLVVRLVNKNQQPTIIIVQGR